jgi:hypothetical protein
MRKKIFIIIFILMMMPVGVKAARIPCTTKNFSKLKALTYDVKLSYDLIKNEENQTVFRINISNLKEELEVRYGNITISYDPENSVQEITTVAGGGFKYEVDLYVTEGLNRACVGEKVATKTVDIPKYNYYSERDECIDYEKFYLCNKWYKGDIKDEKYFLEELEKYIGKNKEEEPEKPEKYNIIDRIIDLYKDHPVISITVTVLIAGAIIFVIARKLIRRKNRIKLDI